MSWEIKVWTIPVQLEINMLDMKAKVSKLSYQWSTKKKLFQFNMSNTVKTSSTKRLIPDVRPAQN